MRKRELALLPQGLSLWETDEGEYEELTAFGTKNGLEWTRDEDEEVPTDLVQCYKIVTETGSLSAIGILALRESQYVLDGIAVDPAYRHLKLGSLILSKVIEETKRLGGKVLYLVAKAPNFFRANGFQTIDPEDAPNFFECKYCPQYGISCQPEVMRKDLG